ncbi:hypothetical protein PEPS_06270 [Persicobacter psychrovividus]|uniref:3-deoxy-manno-octulosonate-8-phosphatase n=2 Tax=Persicobacter psychrovividus TaxID=387638 RepID=A0ABN6LAM7_9BACT|nr:hypothetical protein PEPS_06270 [Persicobacter psychrovividus]
MVITDVDGTLTDGGMYYTEQGDEFKKFNAKDGMGMNLLRKAGIEVGIISHGKAPHMVLNRAERLGLKYCYVGQEPKMKVLEGWLKELNISAAQVCYIGDDINDQEIMESVGLSACPADAVKVIRATADIVLSRGGGDCAFRELVDEHLLG